MILSKLTYGAYLFHMSLQIRDAAMLRQPFYFNYIYMVRIRFMLTLFIPELIFFIRFFFHCFSILNYRWAISLFRSFCLSCFIF